MRPTVARRSGALTGEVTAPGDKSISHRALILGALAVGETVVDGLLEGEDVLRTAAAMRALGAEVVRDGAVWRVHGCGVGGLAEPDSVLDLGNSGTAVRLLIGVAAGHDMTCFLTGDPSLVRRPMARVTTPLKEMGARFLMRSGERLPGAVIGSATLRPITYELPVASAQVKSAILLAGLSAAGETTVVEPSATRDHSENMLRHFGATVRVADRPQGGGAVTLVGQPELTGQTVSVPGDPSSAAFVTVAALLCPGSQVTIRNVGVNQRRDGVFRTLLEMGADLRLENRRDAGGEPVADLRVASSSLAGADVPAERAPSMIDEYPILAVAAAFADGTTRMRGLGELRVKESDRLQAMADGLAACGARVAIEGDDLVVHGNGEPPAGGATIATQLDHRIAMSFLVLGLATAEPVQIDDADPIETSFPGFASLLSRLGAAIAA